MKNAMWALLGVVLVLGAGDIHAQNVTESSKQAVVAKLKIEYRLRVHAQNMASDLDLFDDIGILGRGIPRSVVLDNQENTAGISGGRFPEPSNPPSSALFGTEPGFEIQLGSLRGFDMDGSLQDILKDLKRLDDMPTDKSTRN